MKKVKAVQDDSSNWYLIPNELHEQFDKDCQSESMADSGEFDVKYGEYRTGDSLNNTQLYIKDDLWVYLKLENGKYVNAPEVDRPVIAILQWFMSEKMVPAIIKYGNWDDHNWKTVDDNSELSHSLNVIKWMYLPEF